MRPESFGDILDVPPEIVEELDRVYGEREHKANPQDARSMKPRQPELPLRHTPPMGEDMVVLPKHYARFEIEPIRFIAVNKLGFLEANIIKYTCRLEHKHSDKGLEDSLKVIRYAIMRAKHLQGDPDWWKPYRLTALQAAITEEITSGPQG